MEPVDVLIWRPVRWMTRAHCIGEPAHVFFPERGQSTAVAKAICARCPVTVECLAYANAMQIRHGIWGGLPEKQRRRMRVKLAAGRRPRNRAA